MIRTVTFIIIIGILQPLALIYNPGRHGLHPDSYRERASVISEVQFQGELSLTNNTSDRRIKTVQLYKEGWNFSYPVIKLNSEEKLILHFDLIEDYSETYYYTFIHCDKDWNKSDIFPSEYLTGFPENPVEDVKPSFNTTVRYFHYTLPFPNERISFQLSGNYAVVVYPFGEPDKPALIQRFIVTEERAKTDFRAFRPLVPALSNTGQQFEFTVSLTSVPVTDPMRNVYCSVLQNGRWDNAKTNLKPDFTGNNELRFNSMTEKNIFPAGNEFRYFDIRSIRYQTEFIMKIDYSAPYYHIYLVPSESREIKPYFYWQDFNGKYYIASSEGKEPETDADYVYVYFTLPAKQMMAEGNVYVSGSFNNWSLNDNNLIPFNPGNGHYECAMLLKQGWYNYEYTFLKRGESQANAAVFEGNHFETENDYLVLVYYRNPYERYDRVIGTAVANTSNRTRY